MPRSSASISPDFFTASQTVNLRNGPGGAVFGRSVASYEIHKRRDVRNNASHLGYVLSVKQRIFVPNTEEYQPGPTSQSTYTYPAILTNSLSLTANSGATVQLLRMFPRTLNSSVSTSQNSSDTTGNSQSHQNSTGSSNTNVNTFGVAVTGGIFGEMPIATLTLDYSHSWEDSRSRSTSDGQSTSAGAMRGAGESMSIKDWSSYGYLDQDSINPTWVFGQSYPWDVIQYHQSPNNSNIELPSFVADRLIDGELLLPPSELSQFGLDFLVTGVWLIDFPEGITEEETISITHTVTSYTATHSLVGGKVSASLQPSAGASQATFGSGTLALSTYSLIPLNGAGSGNGSAIGFSVTPFVTPPVAPTNTFKIVSPANTLQVTGTGFDGNMVSEFKTPTGLKLLFKIADFNVEYALLLLHWLGEGSGPVKLSWKVNGKWTGDLYVDAMEGTGGQNNVSSIELRNTKFTSMNFHDYLLIGTNEIDISIAPIDPSAGNSYKLFAAAIGPT